MSHIKNLNSSEKNQISANSINLINELPNEKIESITGGGKHSFSLQLTYTYENTKSTKFYDSSLMITK